MKKLFVVLLALTVFGIFAFADDAAAPALTFGAYLDSGFQFNTAKAATVKANNIVARGYDQGQNSNRLDFTGTLDGDVYGLGFRFRTDNIAASPTAIDVAHAYAYVTFLDGMLKVIAGENADGSFDTAYEGYGDWYGADGLLLIAKPMGALTVGYFLPTTTTQTAVSDAMKNSGFGAAYTMEKMFGFTFNMQNIGLKAPTVYTGLNILAVENLTAQIEAKLVMGSAYDYRPEQYFAYAMGALKPELFVKEYLLKSKDAAFLVQPGATYDLGDGLKVRGRFGYELDSNASDNVYYLEGRLAKAMGKVTMYVVGKYKGEAKAGVIESADADANTSVTFSLLASL